MSLVELKNVGKSYYGNQVLQDVNLTLEPGEVHGLVGENGAGKSTLMNVLFGMPVITSTGGYDGEMMIDGAAYDPKSPLEAMDRGIGMVHQEFMLIPGFTVVENVKLNRENTKPSPVSKVFGKGMEVLDKKQMEQDTQDALDRLQLELDKKQTIKGMPVGYMQFVEIAREIDKTNLKLLILDEPTAVLTESEASQFLAIIRNLSEMGIAILFITHRLDEIIHITDRITVLRDGKQIVTLETKNTNTVEIAETMVGRNIEAGMAKARTIDPDAPVALKIENMRVHMPGEMIRDLSLEVKKGEILGIGGLAGQGKLGVANGIMGMYKTEGKIYKDGEEMKLNSPRWMLDNGVAFLSEDRKEVGLLLDEPIDFNIAYTSLEIKDAFLKSLGPVKLLDKQTVRKNGEEMIEKLDIRCRGPKQHTRSLSGGNQQKVCIARALTFQPDILLISEPTRGIDIGAKELVIDTLRELNETYGMTIIITSSELAELKQLADRIAIITEGRLQEVLPPTAEDKYFGLAMSGQPREEVAIHE